MAIERVHGLALDQSCARAATAAARAPGALLLGVLDAVQFAHQNLIVHRDLKPAERAGPGGWPAAKLLDFGVAKLLGEVDHTQTGGRAPMTFAYAAPEQIKRRCDHGRHRRVCAGRDAL
jgi:serine/threonine protein kinase